LNGAASELNTCTTCVQSVDATLAQQLIAAAQDCLILFPSSARAPSIATPSITAPANLCAGACAPIIQAATCVNDTCACPAYLSAGATCLQCTGTVNATASSSISRSISICFSELLNRTGTATLPMTSTAPPCATPCGPIINAQTCTDNACACPAYLTAGGTCLQCTGTLNATASSIIAGSISTCLSQSLNQTRVTATGVPTGLPCASECSDILQAPVTCSNEMCSCTAYLKEGSSCYTCTAPFNATAAGILSKDISICQSNYPGLGTAVPTPPPCFSPCAFTLQIGAVCGTVNVDDACFCPTFVASAPACSSCYATVNVTQAARISEALDICSSKFPSLFTHSGSTSPTSRPTTTSPRVTSSVTVTATTQLSGSHDNLKGLLGEFEIQWSMLFAFVGGLLAVFL
jgi:hypothetical protein